MGMTRRASTCGSRRTVQYSKSNKNLKKRKGKRVGSESADSENERPLKAARVGQDKDSEIISEEFRRLWSVMVIMALTVVEKMEQMEI